MGDMAENTAKEEKKRGKFPWRGLLMCLFLLGFLGFGGRYLFERNRAQEEAAVNNDLQLQLQQAKERLAALPGGTESQYGADGRLLVYSDLADENADFAAWLLVPGTRIDYPVMYTPQEPERYLRRSFRGTYAISGSLFIGEGCTPEGSSVLIYGHNMKNGTMFGDLMQYASEEFCRQHPTLYYDTLYEQGEYAVVAAFRSRVYYENEEGVFRYYRATDLSREEDFNAFLSEVSKAALYDTGVQPQFGDQILILSTCSYHVDDGRFVVIASRIS